MKVLVYERQTEAGTVLSIDIIAPDGRSVGVDAKGGFNQTPADWQAIIDQAVKAAMKLAH